MIRNSFYALAAVLMTLGTFATTVAAVEAAPTSQIA